MRHSQDELFVAERLLRPLRVHAGYNRTDVEPERMEFRCGLSEDGPAHSDSPDCSKARRSRRLR